MEEEERNEECPQDRMSAPFGKDVQKKNVTTTKKTRFTCPQAWVDTQTHSFVYNANATIPETSHGEHSLGHICPSGVLMHSDNLSCDTYSRD